MPELVLILMGGGALIAAAAILLFIAAAMIHPEAFSRTFSSMVGMLSGLGIVAVLLLLGVLCVCLACAVGGLLITPPPW